MAERVILKTPKVRLAFAQLFEAKSFQAGQEAKFSATLIFDAAAQASPEYKQLQAAAAQAVKDKWGTNVPNGFKNPFRKGTDRQGYDGFPPDCVFINVTSKQKPDLVGRERDVNQQLRRITESRELYSGCFVRASLTCYAYDNVGKGVAFGLNAVQKMEDGPSLGNRVKAEEAFEPLGDDPAPGNTAHTGAAAGEQAKASSVEDLFK